MKQVVIIFASSLFLLGCSYVKNTVTYPVCFQRSQTLILAQIDSVLSDEGETIVYFTPIESYGFNTIKPIRMDGEKIVPSKFYNRLLADDFREGEMVELLKAQPKLSKKSNQVFFQTKSIRRSQVHKGDVYLLIIEILKSDEEKLFIEFLVKPNKVLFSNMRRLD